jgi:glucose/arabinose dehydrogenase
MTTARLPAARSHRRHRRLAACAVALAALLAAPGGIAGGPDVSGAAVPPIQLTRVATLNYPISATPAGGRAGVLYIAERQGTVRLRWASGKVRPKPVLDIRGVTSTAGEQGLLGIATGPKRGWLYISYTGPDGASRLERARIRDDRSLGRRQRLLTVAQPAANHNGGDVAVDRHGRVYWALGDGGGGNDTYGNGQNKRTLLGSILRLRPDGRAVRSNPFVGRPGRDRIWIYGLRNPWRFSIHEPSGRMWIADVGQSTREEVNRLGPRRQPGANLGWKCWEGTVKVDPCTAPGHVPPVFDYPRNPGCAVTGGYQYRGTRIPQLRRAYVYADYCDGTLRALVPEDGKLVPRSLGVDAGRVVSFAQDAARELFVLTPGGDVFRIDPA